MDFEPTEEQRQLVRAVDAVAVRHCGPARATDTDSAIDHALLGALSQAGFLDVVVDGGPVEGVLVSERLGAAVASAPITERILVGPLAGIGDLPDILGVVEAGRTPLVRYGEDCDAVIELDGSNARMVTGFEAEPVRSRFGYPLAWIRGGRARDLGADAGARVRRAWQVAIAVELAALSGAAVSLAVDHVRERRQFGRPLGSFQAVRHRLARSHSMVEGARWSARRAAWHHDDEFLTASAATFACVAAEQAYQDTHQVCGAIGITAEFGLHARTMRLVSLQRQLGGRRGHARRVAAARRSMDLSGMRRPVHPEVR